MCEITRKMVAIFDTRLEASRVKAKGFDPVNRPAHYTRGKIEVIDFIEDQGFGFHDAQVIKYVARARWKSNELEDLRKAQWYLKRRIEQLQDQELNG